MKRIIALVVASLAFYGTALAGPVATFVAPSAATVGVPVTFDATGTDCATNRCQWSWTYRTSGGSTLNGGQIGEGLVVNYAFGTFAATKPYVTVKLKVTAPGGTNNYTLVTRSLVVIP